MKLPSSTAVLVSAVAALAGTSCGQAQQNAAGAAAYNFYVTTPQTGQQVHGGSTANAASRAGNQQSVQAANAGRQMNLYTSQQQSRVPTVASTSARQGTRRGSASRQNFYTGTNQAASNGYTIQQVSNPAPALASSNTNYRYNNRNASVVTTSARQPNYYTQYQQQQNAAYVSNATASSTQRQGFFSRLVHPHKHSHTQKPQQKSESESFLSRMKPSRLAGRIQEGVASWYGSDWHGKKTANGERYDMNTMTAAHKTLPFGTLVRVKNERNGRECVVRINNRGPFSKGRIIDLSKAAASTLGMIGSGVAKVKCEVIGRS